MTIRFAIALVFASLVSSIPAAASQPEGLAGEIIRSAPPKSPRDCAAMFEWLGYFGEQPLNPTDTVTLDFAIVPFASGITGVGLDFGPYGIAAVALEFEDG